MDCLKEVYIRGSLSAKFAYFELDNQKSYCNSEKCYQIYINTSNIMKVASTFNIIVTRILLKQQGFHK